MKYVDLKDILFPNGIVPISGGGTGANSLAQAKKNLEIKTIKTGTATPPQKGTPDSIYIQYK